MWCKSLLILLIAGAGVALGQNLTNWQPKLLGETHLKHAAFTKLYFSENEELDYIDRWTLYISRFDAGAIGEYDSVYYMRAPGNFLENVPDWEQHIKEMDHSSYWPNEPDFMPSEVIGTEGLIWTSGFLVPSKTNGKLNMFDTTQEPPQGPYNIASTDTDDWAYHRVIWKDMDTDGDLDALTARFHVPTLGKTKYDLVWFENEGLGTFSEGWPEHVVSSEGPDVSFNLVNLTTSEGVQYECILAAEFWQQRVSIYWTENQDGDWSDLSQVKFRYIDMFAGQVFDIIIDDLNSDGEIEFLSTQYDTESGEGRVVVYHIPEDFMTDTFERITIADGFIPHWSIGGNTMSPGTPLTFYPSDDYANEVLEDGMSHKPWIIVSGDDDGKIYMLLPTSEDRTEWTYNKELLLDTTKNTAGNMAVGDLDGDGYIEIVIAGYSAGRVYALTYAP